MYKFMNMKRLGFYLVFCSLLTVNSGRVFGERKGVALHPHVGQNLDLLEVWIKARMAYAGLPGLSIGIVKDQELVYSKGFGFADIKNKIPAGPNTLYRIASHSKLFAAIGIMQLRDQGKLQLDDPVKKHLRAFNIAITHPEAHQVTIRHLLTHSSGLPREAGSPYWVDFNFPSMDEVLARLGSQETILPSESIFKYSNLAYALLGEIIAQKTDQSFADYVEKNIMEPLGMDDSSVVFREGDKSKLAVGYGRRMPDGTREVFPFVDARGMAAATGVTSSIVDMAKFVSWQLHLRKQGGKKLIAARTLKEMQRPHWVIGDWKHGRGLGFAIFHTNERELIGHGGGYPGYKTVTNISSREDIGVIVFANSLDSEVYIGSPRSITDRIFDWIVPAIHEVEEGKEGLQIRPEWKTLVGTYRMPWQDSHIMFLDGTMSLIDPNTPNPKKTLNPLEHISGNVFKIIRKFRAFDYGSVGETVSFEFGQDKKVKQVKIGALYAKPIQF